MKPRKRRRLIAAAAEKLVRTKSKPAAAAVDEPTEQKPTPKGPSFEKPESDSAAAYKLHGAQGTKFRDPRGRRYGVSDAGELRALNKPRSREKRRREEAAQKKQRGTDRGA